MAEQQINSRHVRSKLIESWANDPNDEVMSRAQFAPVVKVFSIVFCFILALSLFFGTFYFADSVFCFKPGTAVSTGYGAYEHKGRQLLEVHYSYTLQGQTFSDSKTVLDTKIRRQYYAEGNRIPFLYNPEKPSESVLNWQERIYFFLIPLITSIVLTVFTYTVYRADRAECSRENGLRESLITADSQ